MTRVNKIGCALVVSLTLGLSGCFMDEQTDTTPVDYSNSSTPMQRSDAGDSQAPAKQKSYASKDPVQKSTPGPKRAAAPQLPVLQ